MSTATITIGPEHDGQRMSLDEFDDAVGREGHLYELSRGVVTVIEVPIEPHFDLLDAIREQLWAYRLKHPEEIHRILGGSDAKIPVEGLESERHPDLLLYKTSRPKNAKGRQIWRVWIPELVIEIVSPGSQERDYNQKPDEYFEFGISEYWIVDPEKEMLTVYQRSEGKWRLSRVVPGEKHTTDLLPGFAFDLKRVFDAANE